MFEEKEETGFDVPVVDSCGSSKEIQGGDG